MASTRETKLTMMVSYPVAPSRWRGGKLVLPLLAAAAFLTNCSRVPEEADPAADVADQVANEMASAVQVDTVGVLSLTEGDTLNMDENLTIIEKTRVFPPRGRGRRSIRMGVLRGIAPSGETAHLPVGR